MATPTLAGRDLPGGEQLLAELDREGFPVIAAFWLFPTADSGWRLVITSPLVDQVGALPVYQRLQAALDRLPEARLSLFEIFAVGEQDSVVRQLRQAFPANFAPAPFSISLTFPNTVPDAPYLEDDDTAVSLYVYRLVPGNPNTAARSA